jgi:hypothetical protein
LGEESAVFPFVAGRVSARRPPYFLCFAKESRQRKATPTVCVPTLRVGQPAVLAPGGVRANSLRSDMRGPFPARRCAPRHRQKGLVAHRVLSYLRQKTTLAFFAAPFQPVVADPFVCAAPRHATGEDPLCTCRAAQANAGKEGRMSEPKASLRPSRIRRAAQVARRHAPGHGQWGSPFFAYFLWRSKESRAAAGPKPGLPRKKKTLFKNPQPQ